MISRQAEENGGRKAEEKGEEKGKEKAEAKEDAPRCKCNKLER